MRKSLCPLLANNQKRVRRDRSNGFVPSPRAACSCRCWTEKLSIYANKQKSPLSWSVSPFPRRRAVSSRKWGGRAPTSLASSTEVPCHAASFISPRVARAATKLAGHRTAEKTVRCHAAGVTLVLPVRSGAAPPRPSRPGLPQTLRAARPPQRWTHEAQPASLPVPPHQPPS